MTEITPSNQQTLRSSQSGEEKIIFVTQPSPLTTLFSGSNLALVGLFFLVWVFGSAFGIGTGEMILVSVIVLIFLLPVLRQALKLIFTSYTLSNHSLMIKSLLIERERTIIPLEEIRKVGYQSSIFSALFKIGDIDIETKRKRYHLSGLSEPDQYARQIIKAAKL